MTPAIREALERFRQVFKRMSPYFIGPAELKALSADIEAIETTLLTPSVEEMLESVPVGHSVSFCRLPRQEDIISIMEQIWFCDIGDGLKQGDGPTPQAAIAAAMEKKDE